MAECQIERKIEIGNYGIVKWTFRNIGNVIRNAAVLAVAGDTDPGQNDISIGNRHKAGERLG